MNEQIKNILHNLRNTTSGLNVIRDLFQAKLDYFNEEDRRKINEFNETFEQKREQIDGKINSFVRFIEKSFAPTAEEIAKEKALRSLNSENNRVLTAELNMGLDHISLREDLNALSALEILTN